MTYSELVPSITFINHDGQTTVASVDVGETITQVAYRAGVKIQQSCGGAPSCGDCVVKVDSQTPDDAFEPMEHPEKALLGNVYFITRERLACQCVIKKDSTVHLPSVKNIKKELYKKR